MIGKISPNCRLALTQQRRGKCHWCLSNARERGRKILVWGFLGSQLSAQLGSNYQLKLLSSVCCLCVSVSQRIFSTVCNHGNHKDVALTIIGSDGVLKDATHTHEHRKSSYREQSFRESNATGVLKTPLGLCYFVLLPWKETFLWKVSYCKHAGFLLNPAYTSTESSTVSKTAAPQELFEFNMWLEGNLTCLLYGYLLSSF